MPRILVIDDEEQVCRLLKTRLEAAGYEVMTSEDGAKGLKSCQENHIDLVITDIFMPEKEGLETIRELKATIPEMKIIAVSGGAHGRLMNFLPIAETMGAQYAFEKPVDFERLMAAIKELVGEPTPKTR